MRRIIDKIFHGGILIPEKHKYLIDNGFLRIDETTSKEDCENKCGEMT